MKRSTTVILWAIILPILALLFLKVVENDPGIVAFSGTLPYFGEFYFALTFSGFLIAGGVLFILGYLLIRLISGIWHLPKRFKKGLEERRLKEVESNFAQAELALLEGNNIKAERLYLAVIEGQGEHQLAYLGAAKAAHQQGNSYRRDRYLKQIDFIKNRKDRLFGALRRAEFLLEINDFEKATELLNQLYRTDRNPQVIQLLADAYYQSEAWSDLHRMMPEYMQAVEREPLHDAQKMESLYLAALNFAASDQNSETLTLFWHSLPERMRRSERLLLRYITLLLDKGEGDEAENALRKALKVDYNPNLMLAYGSLYRGNLPAHIRHARKLVEHHPHIAEGHLALAQLLARNEEYEAAEEATKEALALKSDLPQAHKLLGELHLRNENPQEALLSFRRANDLLIPEAFNPLLQGEGELLLEERSAEESGEPKEEEKDLLTPSATIDELTDKRE